MIHSIWWANMQYTAMPSWYVNRQISLLMKFVKLTIIGDEKQFIFESCDVKHQKMILKIMKFQESLFTNKFILKIHYLKVMIRNPPFYKLFILFNNYNMANANQSLDLLILTTWIIIPFDHLEIESFLGIFCLLFYYE